MDKSPGRTDRGSVPAQGRYGCTFNLDHRDEHEALASSTPEIAAVGLAAGARPVRGPFGEPSSMSYRGGIGVAVPGPCPTAPARTVTCMLAASCRCLRW
jgi:hypothetical protein